MNALENLPNEFARMRILNARQASSFIGMGLQTFRAAYRNGKAPAPIRLSDRRLGWQLGALIDWLEERKAGSKRAA